jgi:HEXXH motif-containing protein
VTPELADLAVRVRRDPARPVVFAWHAGLVEAILAEDAVATNRLLAATTDLHRAVGQGIEFATVSDAAFGLEGGAELFRRLAIDDPSLDIGLGAVGPERLSAAGALANDSLHLLAAVAPELSGELAQLIRQIVFVRSTGTDGFDGASSFHLWGAILINVACHTTRVAMIEGLAHEAGHMLIFGHSLGEPIVENGTEERYPSPLRADLRPMEGIAHAAFVLARMSYAISRMLQSSLLTEAEAEEAAIALERNRVAYEAGADVVNRHARLTAVGRQLLDDAARFMQSGEVLSAG